MYRANRAKLTSLHSMSVFMSCLNPQGEGIQISGPDAPDTCPVCHHAGHMDSLATPVLRKAIGRTHDILQMSHRCPRKQCGAHFITEYEGSANRNGTVWRTVGSYPSTSVKRTFAVEIQNISPNFVNIYNQAQEAKRRGLDELYGMGLRKALEFLIKDYCLSNATDDTAKEVIKSQLLGAVIKNHVTDGRLKQCAERAAWLGNDETHYEKKWGADVSELEQLIHLTVNWIDSEIATAAFLKKMPPGGKKAAP